MLVDQRLQEFARQMRRKPTPGEDMLWKRLRNRRLGGFRFRRQQVIGPFIVDFFCPDLRLVVELDGDVHIGREKYDMERQQWLESQGLTVLRIGTVVTVKDGEDIPAVILEVCRQLETSSIANLRTRSAAPSP